MPDLTLTIAEVAELVSGEVLLGDSGLRLNGIQTLAKANSNEVSFLSNMKYKAGLGHTKAGLVLLALDIEVPETSSFAVIRLKNPYVGFALLQNFFYPAPVSTGIEHSSAVIDASATIAGNVQVDAHASIGKSVNIGAGSIIGAGCVLSEGVSVGEGCLLHARVVLEKGTQLGHRVIIQSGSVLGSDGFGFAWTGTEYLKIPQVGNVVIEDDVEIGANTCIDRGAIEDTIIRKGAKLDNLVQIGHNVEVGVNTVMAGQTGISGSTVIGAGCQFGGQSGTAGHLHIVDGAIVGAKAGVIGDITKAGMVSGFPAVPHRHWLKATALFDRLPTIWNKIKRLT